MIDDEDGVVFCRTMVDAHILEVSRSINFEQSRSCSLYYIRPIFWNSIELNERRRRSNQEGFVGCILTCGIGVGVRVCVGFEVTVVNTRVSFGQFVCR